MKEFQEIIDDICERYPQVELYLKNKQVRNMVDLLKEAKGDAAKESMELNIEEFKSALSEVDSQMKNLPATAQVIILVHLVHSGTKLMHFQGINHPHVSGCKSARRLSC